MTASAPKGLGTRGRRFFNAVAEKFELSPPELELLLETARTLDSVEVLQTAVHAAGGVDLPALREVRQQRLVLGRLLAQLNVPDADLESPGTIRGRKAANVRWAMHERRGAKP